MRRRPDAPVSAWSRRFSLRLRSLDLVDVRQQSVEVPNCLRNCAPVLTDAGHARDIVDVSPVSARKSTTWSGRCPILREPGDVEHSCAG